MLRRGLRLLGEGIQYAGFHADHIYVKRAIHLADGSTKQGEEACAALQAGSTPLGIPLVPDAIYATHRETWDPWRKPPVFRATYGIPFLLQCDFRGDCTNNPERNTRFYANADNPSGNMTPRYIVVEWTPSIGSTIPLIGNPAPPPLHEYLISLDQLSKAACLLPYAATGKAFNAALAGGSYWYHGIQLGPGLQALRPMVTVARTGANSVGPPAEFWTTDSGATANDKILVEPLQSGPLYYPPSLQAEVVPGGEDYDETPAAPSYRHAEVTADREPRYQAVWGQYYCGWGYRPRRFWPEPFHRDAILARPLGLSRARW